MSAATWLSDQDLAYDSADDEEAMLVDFQRQWSPDVHATRGCSISR